MLLKRTRNSSTANNRTHFAINFKRLFSNNKTTIMNIGLVAVDCAFIFDLNFQETLK